MLASESDAVSVVEVLVQRGADLSAVDSQGHDVVHYTKLLGNSEVKSALTAALNRQHVSGKSYAKSHTHTHCRSIEAAVDKCCCVFTLYIHKVAKFEIQSMSISSTRLST